jgi:hypothetical protein
MRPKHPHAAESGVGKHTARESESAQACAAAKENIMTSTFTTTADETTAQVIDTVTKVQNATLEAVTTFANNVPDVTKFVESLPKFDLPFELPKLPAVDLPQLDLPTPEEVAAAYFGFIEQLVATSKSFTERFIEASKPALAAV